MRGDRHLAPGILIGLGFALALLACDFFPRYSNTSSIPVSGYESNGSTARGLSRLPHELNSVLYPGAFPVRPRTQIADALTGARPRLPWEISGPARMNGLWPSWQLTQQACRGHLRQRWENRDRKRGSGRGMLR
jgi:hypothetical protein